MTKISSKKKNFLSNFLSKISFCDYVLNPSLRLNEKDPKKRKTHPSYSCIESPGDCPKKQKARVQNRAFIKSHSRFFVSQKLGTTTIYILIEFLSLKRLQNKLILFLQVQFHMTGRRARRLVSSRVRKSYVGRK